MPAYATFHNTIFDIRCSKCKRTQEPQYFTQNGKLYKTCNACRGKAARRRMDPEFLASLASPERTIEVRHIPDSDSESDVSVNPRASLYALGFNYNDADAERAVNEILALSSSAAASSSSSAGYFVDEPDPEPEPEGP